ncbi:MAG TPA: hypothetical protein PKA20_07185 [Burkholderiaceae bacterium]|nr:hypothetical protein [Burkholderiaceae bacterium]
MRILQNAAISPPETEYLVAFSVAGRSLAHAARRTVLVLAGTPAHAKKICKLRYPRGLHLQVFTRPPERRPDISGQMSC